MPHATFSLMEKTLQNARNAEDTEDAREEYAARTAALRIMAENMQAAKARLADIDLFQSLEVLVTEHILSQDAVSGLAQPAPLPSLALRLLD